MFSVWFREVLASEVKMPTQKNVKRYKMNEIVLSRFL